MPDPTIRITLERNDWGQIVDCLQIRLTQYQETADYYEEGVSWGSIIEEVSGADEANNMVRLYGKLLNKLTGALDKANHLQTPSTADSENGEQ